MPRHSFIQMQKLPNVRGRINYISSHARQENLYAAYDTAPFRFWGSLARESQREFKKSGTQGTCVEARELIIALPERFHDCNPETVLKVFTDFFKEKHQVECTSALHHNKRKTNYHIHLIFSERQLLQQPALKIAARNMFYNEQGNHVRTKKEILDDKGTVRGGCKIIPKGAVYESRLFSNKNSCFKTERFLEEEKKRYTELINQSIRNPSEQLQVFEKNSVYLPTKKIGKNNPKANEIKSDNQARTEWNQTVDIALVGGVPSVDVLNIKQNEIYNKVRTSISENGKMPGLLRKIILMAKDVLQELIGKFMLPPKPKLKVNIAEFQRMASIKRELDQQVNSIHQVEQNELPGIKRKLAEITGIFKGKERRTIEQKIKDMEERLFNMKSYLQKMVIGYGYKSVQKFMSDYQASESEVWKYQRALKAWKEKSAMPLAEKQSIRDSIGQCGTKVKTSGAAQVQKTKRCKGAR